MQTADSAKQFLLNRVLEQASLEGLELSDVERRMFLFSEVSQNPPDWEANERFEAECDDYEYEKKIAKLLVMLTLTTRKLQEARTPGARI